MEKVMKDIINFPLEGGSKIFEVKRHDMLCESTPWSRESSFVLVFMMDLDLTIPQEYIHVGEDLMPKKSID
jgi:hypothetical protein